MSTEHEFVFTYDIEYTVTIHDTKTFTFAAASLADAKRQADAEAHSAEGGDYFYADLGRKFPSGYEVESADVEMDTLTDQDTGEDYDSLAIEEGDEEPFMDDDDGD